MKREREARGLLGEGEGTRVRHASVWNAKLSFIFCLRRIGKKEEKGKGQKRERQENMY